MHDPKVLVLDEPTVGLDPKSARLIKDMLRQLADRGAAVFLSTHILEIAERMCDRIGIINQGRADRRRQHGRAALPGQGGDQPGGYFPEPDGRRRIRRDHRGPEMTVTTQTQPGSNLWRTVWKLMRLRWVIFTSSFRRGKLRSKIMTIFLGLLLLGGMAAAFVISSALLKFLRSASARRVRGRCESLPGKRTGPGGVGGICGDPAGQFWRAAAGAVPGRRYGISAQRADTDPGCFRHQDDPGYPAILRPDPAVRAARAVWIGLFRRL